jgi:A/G-specific adenine glycosylase
VDTNVRRVQERTGETFDAACAQALMDLGREICLARVPRCGTCPLAESCPSRGRRFAPLRKQGPFEGSFRQRRAETLRRVASGPVRVADLDEAVVISLRKDGLVALRRGVVVLPD